MFVKAIFSCNMGVAQNQTGGANRRFWSMFPLTRASHFGTGFLSHSHMTDIASPGGSGLFGNELLVRRLDL